MSGLRIGVLGASRIADDAVTNMQYIDTAYTAAGMSPR